MATATASLLPDKSELDAAAEVVYRTMQPTPQFPWPLLAERMGTEVWVKHENHTPLGAFKVRGGLVYFDHVARHRRDVAGVIAATRGNHGQSVAFGAGKQGLPTTIVVPHGNSQEKNRAMVGLGAELIEHGDDFQASLEYARGLAEERALHMVGSFHRLLVAGVATYGVEFFTAVPDLDVVYVPIGLGSGICATLAARDALGSKAEVVGVVSTLAPAYAESLAARRSVECPATTCLADGMACRTPHPEALDILWQKLDRIVQVSDEQVGEAMMTLFECTHNVAEGAGAASFAAAYAERDRLAGQKVGVVLTGGNVDRQIFAGVLQGNY